MGKIMFEPSGLSHEKHTEQRNTVRHVNTNQQFEGFDGWIRWNKIVWDLKKKHTEK